MPIFLVTLRALGPLFLLIAIGYGLKRARVLHAAHVPILNKLVLYVTLPALVIKSLTTAPYIPKEALALPPALLAAEAATMLAAWLIGRAAKLPPRAQGALMVVGVFGNTGFLGYPMSLALHPALLPEAVLLDQLGMSIALYLSVPLLGARFGAAGGGEHGMRATLQRFFRSPLFIALVTAGACRFIPWPASLLHAPPIAALGSVVSQCLGYLGAATTPVVLLALGAALNPQIKAVFSGPILAASGLKLVFCPLIMAVACHAFGLDRPLIAQGLLSAAMPTSVMSSVLAAEHDLSGEYAVTAVFCSTLLAALTVPLVLAALH